MKNGNQFLEAGLSSKVVETLLNARDPSTRKLYALKRRLFHLWCGQYPVHGPVGTVLELFQSRLFRGMSPSTLNCTWLPLLQTMNLSSGPLWVGTLWSRLVPPSLREKVGLLEAPFEPLESASEKFLTLKTAMFLALPSLRRVSRVHSTKGITSSSALARAVPFQEICAAAGWSSPHTFIRFYNLDLDPIPGSQVFQD
ncbi:hypothetical protein QTP70_015327 [Hemibagrus guttatus]|uniref:Uncharacterized protein n=1 Tax=Hemibagrus guttatus TaxID=175788 RepID=A0AAE0PRL4_9TELE|nr:hypothetical protein QTP70_015327 [Hemibagrus guttatus]